MKKTWDVKIIAMNAIVAAVYAVFTFAIAPIAYGAIQMRISEIIVFLAFYNKKYIPGLVIGCFLANIPSSLGAWDLVFGTFSTLVVCFAMYYIKNIFMAAIAGGIITGIIVGAELTFVFFDPFIVNFIYVFIGEVIVLVAGAVLFRLLEHNHEFMKKYICE